MKTRILGAALGIAVLSGLLVASPAQARDGVSSARIDTARYGGGSVRATVDFVNRRKVVFRNFTVRDLCPGDNLPVRARAWWRHTDGTNGYGAWKSDTNGCGDDGTNFGNITRRSTKPIAMVWVEVSVYIRPGERTTKISKTRDNQYN
ncbi:hypothetical protein LDL08_12655 [Nonomuraea glycinis]|uniref:Secreted protein n=1 Tax=Nonomuraea glycinis TaxID=2047744 RepID=A0A918A0I9_9ACTN|nr:hypothetical protein [Nonomuraea glycinis]MCA2177032.1 hypothetical protein [Nonomuraea glycinis]GGP02809.1 hypothetical protein GCM10012278_11510 [Nonomuraea glycinis]